MMTPMISQLVAFVVEDFEFHTERRAALSKLVGHLRLVRRIDKMGRQRAKRTERRKLGHAPGVEHLDIVILLEGAQDVHTLSLRPP